LWRKVDESIGILGWGKVSEEREVEECESNALID
jgi:hypothetical protein